MPHHFATDAVAAMLSSTTYTFMFYPIHRVKVLLQTQEGHPDIVSGKVKRYTFASSFGRIVREQGWHSLWRGWLPYLLRHVPSTTLSFAFKDALQRAMPGYDANTQPHMFAASRILAGGCAGVLALAVVYPLDLTTIRMATHIQKDDPSMLETIERSTRAGGIRSLYRGFGVSAIAIGGYKALYFGLYDTAKAVWLGHHLPPVHPQHPTNVPAIVLGQQQVISTQHAPRSSLLQQQGLHQQQEGSSTHSQSTSSVHTHTTAQEGDGMQSDVAPSARATQYNTTPSASKRALELLQAWIVASGVVYVASTVTYPLDVVRKRWVVDTGLPVRKYHSISHCVACILKEEGVRGLYRFYGYDMLLRFGGGMLLVMYDELRGGVTDLAAQRQTGPALD